MRKFHPVLIALSALFSFEALAVERLMPTLFSVSPCARARASYLSEGAYVTRLQNGERAEVTVRRMPRSGLYLFVAKVEGEVVSERVFAVCENPYRENDRFVAEAIDPARDGNTGWMLYRLQQFDSDQPMVMTPLWGSAELMDRAGLSWSTWSDGADQWYLWVRSDLREISQALDAVRPVLSRRMVYFR